MIEAVLYKRDLEVAKEEREKIYCDIALLKKTVSMCATSAECKAHNAAIDEALKAIKAGLNNV